MSKITGNSLFVTAMKKEGVDTIFAYPGGMMLGISDALYDAHGIDLVLPRHEQGLIFAADGYARATGKVGVCLVTSGPGATNLVTGIATANYDSVPLVCFTGQVPEHLIGNDAFQEVDIVGITRNIAKYSFMVTNREDLGRQIKEAFYIAKSGKPGPVVVDLPADVMAELGSTSYPTNVNIRGYKPNKGVHMGQLKKAIGLIKEARRPVFLIGGGVHMSGAQAELTEMAEKLNIPVVTTVMGRGAISTEHPLFIGNVGMHGSYAANKTVDECDLLVSIGCRFNDRVTGDVSKFAPHAKIVHIDIESAAISRNVSVDIPIVADAKAAISKILQHTEPMNHKAWIKEAQSWNVEHPLHVEVENGVNPMVLMQTLNEIYKDSDTIYTADVGQHQMWAAHYLRLDENHQLIHNGGLGSMGYGLPAAVGAKIGRPEAEVISISGDGGYQMNMQEFATACCQEIPLVCIVLNNHYLGMVRQLQELYWNKRYPLTCLQYHKSCKGKCGTPGWKCPAYVPEFTKVAEAYGCKGYTVTEDSQLKSTIEEARDYAKKHHAPVMIECAVNPHQLVLPAIQGGKSFADIML